MRKFYLFAAVLTAATFGSATARAANQLLYSFETTDSPALDGFTGFGLTPSQSTIGATVGTGSMEMQVPAAGTFTAARTTTDLPAALDLPITAISVDVTNTSQYAGTFADIGVLMFLSNPGIGDFGEQFQADAVGNIAFAPGESTITIPLTGLDFSTHVDNTWAQELASNPGYSVSGFQLFVSKDSSSPLTTYVDNVQAVGVPEPTSIAACIGATGLLLARRRRKA